jgi:hypothetical protein
MTEYRIFTQDGKYGLVYSHYSSEQVVLEPVYFSLEIINEDGDLQSLVSADVWRKLDGFWMGIGEVNFAIVEADGKQGLIFDGETLLEFKYERIIKLSYRHYLCKEGIRYTLYDYPGVASKKHHQLDLLATIEMPNEFSLENALDTLAQVHPEIYSEFSKYLCKDSSTGTYVSRYRRWDGRVGFHMIFLTVAIQKAVIDNDFRVTPLAISELN